MSDLDWDDLRYFLAAARAGSLASAARALSIEHTTVGRRIAGLERVLGGSVVLRNPDGLELTALGRELVPIAEQAERAARAALGLAPAARARVRLAVPSGTSQLFAHGLGELRRRHPAIVLELRSGSQLVDLRRGEADLAMRFGPTADPELVTRKLADVGMALYASRQYLGRRTGPLDVDDLAGHDVVAFDPALAPLPTARWLNARTGGANIVLRGREMTDLLAAILGGLGVGVLPCYLADEQPSLARLTRQPVATLRLALAYRRDVALFGAVRAVADFVIATMQRQAARLAGRH